MKNLLLSLTILSFTLPTLAQGLEWGRIAEQRNEERTPLMDRLYAGGNFGGGISNLYVFVEVSPLLGYMITDAWSAGVGFTYQYFNNRLYYYKTNIVGPRIFTRYQVFDFLFLHAEYEHLFLKYKESTAVEAVKVQAPGFLVGGGLSSGQGRNIFYLMLLYNVLESPYTPYSNPVLRVGFTFGL